MTLLHPTRPEMPALAAVGRTRFAAVFAILTDAARARARPGGSAEARAEPEVRLLIGQRSSLFLVDIDDVVGGEHARKFGSRFNNPKG